MKETEFDIAALPDDQLPAACKLPGKLSEVAEVIDVKPTFALADRFRGANVYFS